MLIARWMNRGPRLLLLDEPTQGVDVGTRAQIFAALRAAARRGMSMICASSDSEQLSKICDRLLVFSRGAVCDELTGAGITKEGIAAACHASLDLATPPPGNAIPDPAGRAVTETATSLAAKPERAVNYGRLFERVALPALAIIVPLTARDYDLSVGATKHRLRPRRGCSGGGQHGIAARLPHALRRRSRPHGARPVRACARLAARMRR